MKIVIPENISEITLEQFQKFIDLDKVDGITDWSSFVGSGPESYDLGYTTDEPDPSYGGAVWGEVVPQLTGANVAFAVRARVVLLRGLDNNGLTFFTNYNSSKSLDIDINNNVSINFFWPQLEKQVRILGSASKISSDESDIYFNSRPKHSQLGALLSNQSTEISLDHDYTNHLSKLEAEHANKKVIRPKYWGGYRVMSEYFEFWQGRPSRLHDRLCYSYKNNSWLKTRKSP